MFFIFGTVNRYNGGYVRAFCQNMILLIWLIFGTVMKCHGGLVHVKQNLALFQNMTGIIHVTVWLRSFYHSTGIPWLIFVVIYFYYSAETVYTHPFYCLLSNIFFIFFARIYSLWGGLCNSKLHNMQHVPVVWLRPLSPDFCGVYIEVCVVDYK